MSTTNMSYEVLEQFKGAINMIEFAASPGYILDPCESTRNSLSISSLRLKPCRDNNNTQLILSRGL